MKASLALLLPALLIAGAGCGATTEVVLAPFELTSDVTSSTTPGATALNGHAKAHQQLETFAAYSYDSVRSDIARGDGEYLVSLATLAGVPDASRSGFQAEMQNQYAGLYDPNVSRKETWRRVVNTAWFSGYGRALGSQ